MNPTSPLTGRITFLSLIVALIVGFAGAGNASAAPTIAGQPPAAATSPAADDEGPDLPPPGTVIILSERTTKRILAAVISGGASGGVLMCQALAPAGFKEACSAIVAAMLAAAAAGRRDGQCIRIAVRLGRPPLVISLVPCPPGPSDEDHVVQVGASDDQLRLGVPQLPQTAPVPRPVLLGPGGLGVLLW